MLFARLFVLSCCLILGMPSARAELADLPLAPGAYRWADDAAASGPLYLIISLERQRVHVYRGDRLIGAASVSTGTKGHRTPTGSFPILQKRQWQRQCQSCSGAVNSYVFEPVGAAAKNHLRSWTERLWQRTRTLV